MKEASKLFSFVVCTSMLVQRSKLVFTVMY